MLFGFPYLLQPPDIWQNSDEVFSISRFLVKSLINKNFHDCSFMILTPNLDCYLSLARVIRRHQKCLTITSRRLFITSLSFFWYVADFEQCWSRILDMWSINLDYSLMTNLNSNKIWAKIFITALVLLLRGKVLFLPKHADFLQKKMLT